MGGGLDEHSLRVTPWSMELCSFQHPRGCEAGQSCK